MSTSAVSIAVARWAPRLRDVLRYVRSRLPQGQRQADSYVGPLCKSVLSYDPPRSRCLEQIVAFVADQAQRGDLADAEFIGRELVAIARAEWERSHPTAQVGRTEAHLAEQRADGLFNDAQLALVADDTPANRAKFYAAAAAHQVAVERLVAVEHRYDREVGLT